MRNQTIKCLTDLFCCLDLKTQGTQRQIPTPTSITIMGGIDWITWAKSIWPYVISSHCSRFNVSSQGHKSKSRVGIFVAMVLLIAFSNTHAIKFSLDALWMMVNVSTRYSQPIAPRLKGRKEEGKHGKKYVRRSHILLGWLKYAYPLSILRGPNWASPHTKT